MTASAPHHGGLLTPQERLAGLAAQRFGMFLHFNMGTFTDEEWTSPCREPATFAPTDVDCDQWARAAAAAGMTYAVLTTKHHDGFCLWPSATTDYTVMSSGFRHDVVRRFVDAFRAHGLRIGLYFSIWDRAYPIEGYNGRDVLDPEVAVTPEGVEFALAQVRELLTGYGPIDLFITDGYGWEMGQQGFPYQPLRETVRELQPDVVMVDHGGLVEPWLGDAIYFEEPIGVSAPPGNTYAALQGQTVSPTWFWRTTTPGEPIMTTEDILGHLTESEERYTSFLLNCSPNRDGVLEADVVERLAEVGRAWHPNYERPPLPAQPLRVEHPISPAAASDSGHDGEHVAANLLDGRANVDCQSLWSTEGLTLPQSVTIDLGGTWSGVAALEVLPQQWHRKDPHAGDPTAWTVLVSTDGQAFEPMASGRWPQGQSTRFAEWEPVDAAFVRLQVDETTGGHVVLDGVRVGARTARPERVTLA